MNTKADNPVKLLAGKEVHPIIRLYFELCQLKQLYRQGWLRRGVSEQRCETVAEHSFATALLSMWLAQAFFEELDLCKVVQIALVHDLGEIYAGDIIPSDQVPLQEKQQREAESIRRTVQDMPEGDAWLQLWEEFEQGQTPEARLVRQVDRLEMGLQAAVYDLQGFDGMDEFLVSARRGLEDAALIQLMEAAQQIT